MHHHQKNWKVYLQSLPEAIFILYNLSFIGPWIKSSLLTSSQVRNYQFSPIRCLACLGRVFEASLQVLHCWVSSSSLFCYLLCDLQNTSKEDKNWSSGAPSLTIYDSGLVISWVLSLISISYLVQSLPHIFGRGFCSKFAQHLKKYFAVMTEWDSSKQALLWRCLHPMKSLGLHLHLLRIKSHGVYKLKMYVL